MLKKPVIFGSDLDFLDDPARIFLKRAWLDSQSAEAGLEELPIGPYQALAPLLQKRIENSRLMGTLEVPGWLTPRPRMEDADLVTGEAFRWFMDSGDHELHVERCGRAAGSVLGGVPLMIAVDHSMSAGPVRALSAGLGRDELAVVVLDSHFDAIPAGMRSARCRAWGWDGSGLCGSFLAGLLDREVIVASQLFVVGVSDFPRAGASGPYADEYRRLVDRGVRVYPKSAVRAPGFMRDFKSALESCPAKFLYVSLDVDVGSCSCMTAVRFMDCVGLEEAEVMEVADGLGSLIENGRFRLVGADVTEIDVHLLGLSGPEGSPDRTLEVCADFMAGLFGGT